MSKETIDLMNIDRDNQLSLSPSSEEFQIVGGSTFFGIFNRGYFEGKKDGGNIVQKFLKPMIQVSTVPALIIERTTEILRANGDSYILFFIGLNDEGVPILWLS